MGIDGCWNWTGWINKFGYGGFCLNSKSARAHRVSWQVFKGEIPTGKMVLHRCDNRRCVNPDHLWIGTAKDNMVDCLNKGRHKQVAKTQCPQGHKYTETNTYKYSRGGRYSRRCRKCKAIQMRKARA